ncbi:MAG: septal ring lytic transglycosylase RlpA family protein [Magnetococcus sp. DMHC-6]
MLVMVGCAKVPLEPPSQAPTPPVSDQTSTQEWGKLPEVKTGKPYEVFGVTYYPLKSADGFVQEGIASWYGQDFHGHRTAYGDVYDMNGLTAAHTVLPLPSRVMVTNLENGRQLEVKVNDRGPFYDKRIIDLSLGAAKKLGFDVKGVTRVRIQTLDWYTGLPTKGTMTQQVLSEPTSLEKSVATSLKKAATTSSKKGKNYYIQVGAFQDFDNADDLVKHLEKVGTANIQPIVVNGTKFFRVRFGPFATAEKAKDMLTKLSNKGFGPGAMVRD